MAQMTEEEADALDEYYTQNPPEINTAKNGGYFTRQRELLNVLDDISADYIMTRAVAANKLPAQIIGEMVRERVTGELTPVGK
jgi:hypothetical protein